MTLRSDLLEPQYSHRGPVQNPLYREGDGYSSEEQEQARSNPSYMLTPNPRTSMAFPALARDSFINQAAGFAVSGIPSQGLPEQWTPRVPGERRLSEPGFPPFRGRATSEGPLASHRSESEAPHFGVSPFEVRRSQRGPRPPTLDLSALEGMSGLNPLTRSGQVDRPSQRERSNDPYFEPSSSHVSEGLARGGGISGFVKRAERMRSNNIGRTFERVGSAPLIRIGPASATQAGGNDGVANRRGGAPSLTGGGEGGGRAQGDPPIGADRHEFGAWFPPGGGGGGPPYGGGGPPGGGGGGPPGGGGFPPFGGGGGGPPGGGGGPPGGGGGWGGGPGRGRGLPPRGPTRVGPFQPAEPDSLNLLSKSLMPKAETVKLTEDNWAIWAKVTEGVLRKVGLGHTIERDCGGHWHDTDAWSYIVSVLSDDYKHLVDMQTMGTAYLLWHSLVEMFTQMSKPKINLYLEQLRHITMRKGESPKEYVRRGVKLSNAMRNLGGVYSSLQLCNELLNGLLPEYADAKAHLENQMTHSPSVTSLENTLMVRYTKLQAERREADLRARSPRPSSLGSLPRISPLRPRSPTPSVHQATGGRGSAGNTPRSTTSPRGTPFSAHQTKGRSEGEPPECYYCKQKGHVRNNCLKYHYDKAVEKGDFSMLSVMGAPRSVHCMSGSLYSELERAAWLLDTGSTDYITPTADILSDYVSYTEPQYMMMANGDRELILGHGTARVKLPNGNTFQLFEVKHVPSATRFLMSHSRLYADGLDVHISGVHCHLEDSLGRKLGDAVFSGSYFWFPDLSLPGNASPPKQPVRRVSWADLTCVALTDETGGSTGAGQTLQVAQGSTESRLPDLWHRRFCHVSPELLRKSQGAVVGLDLPAGNVRKAVGIGGQCIDCDLGKMPARRHKSTGNYAERPLHLIHMDLIGKMDVESLDGYLYALTCIDEYSGYSVVRFLVSKSEAFSSAVSVMQMLERQTDFKIAFLRTDGGKEFHRLTSYCDGLGITHQVTPPHDHQANGKIERVNRVLVERSRCLLIDAQIDPEFWAHAMDTVNYTRNFVVASYAVATPHELLYLAKPNVSHLRVFGSVCTAYLPKPVREGKFSPVSVPGVFLGYNGTAFIVLTESGKVSIFSKVECYEFRKPKGDWVFHDPFATLYEEYKDMPELIPVSSIDTDHSDGDGVTGPARGSDSQQDFASLESRGDQEEHLALEPPTGDGLNPTVPEDHLSDPQPAVVDCRDGHERMTPDGVEHRYPTRSRVTMSMLVDVHYTSGTFHVSGNTVYIEPKSFKEAITCQDADKWWEAMDSEMGSVKELGTFSLVELSPYEYKSIKPLPVRWVFKVKLNEKGELDRFKARLVAKGYKQIYGVDYTEVFAPVSKYTTFRFLLSMAVHRNLQVHQLDISTAFLHGDLKEEVYVQQPEGFHVGSPCTVWKLHKALYGLKQAPRAWHESLTSVLVRDGYRKAMGDSSLYILDGADGTTYVLIYVDDILVASVQVELVARAKALLASQFTVKDMGEVSYFLGMQVKMVRDSEGVLQQVKLTNNKLIGEVISDFSLTDCAPKAIPLDRSWRLSADEGEPLPEGNRYRELLGKILYLANTVRPDISFVAGVLSRFAAKPTTHHWRAGLGVLKYLVGTQDLGLVWERMEESGRVVGYVDSDFAGDVSTRKSTSGGVFLSGTAAVSWISKLQQLAALSTVESEFISMCSGVQEALWLEKIASDFDHHLGALVLFSDNTGALVNIRGNPSSQRTKHIGVRYQRMRDEILDGSIDPQYVHTDDNIADMFTKALPKSSFQKLRAGLGMK